MADIKHPSSATMAIATSALRAQQARMRIISENVANANSTAPAPGGTPYRRQVPIFRPEKLGADIDGVKMARVEGDQTPFKSVYDPGHPAADPKGYVLMPNVDPLMEALDMREAMRAYEANLNVIET